MKKKGQQKRIYGYSLLALAVSLLACGCSAIRIRTQETETEMKEGQRKAEIRVVSIMGNELTYVEMTEAETETVQNLTEAETEHAEQDGDNEVNGRQMPEQSGTQMPGGHDADNGSTQMPGGHDADNGSTQMPGGHDADNNSNQMADGQMMMPQSDSSTLPDSMNTVYLPVNIVVHTDQGKNMTFSILEAGDELEALFETDEDGTEIITELWLTGTGG